MAVGYEKELFEKSTNKEHYKREVARKQAELHEHRVRVSSTLQQQLTAQAQAQAQQQLIMNQSGMQNQQLPRASPASDAGFAASATAATASAWSSLERESAT
ncbi:hypothetical protein CJF30_00006579 [Rutstroemia sp. NJR-2017a BBW]|nr:hypothetical protein CJF30_00006579 [Rutstroemia sp. NJR-2017a BBW]